MNTYTREDIRDFLLYMDGKVKRYTRQPRVYGLPILDDCAMDELIDTTIMKLSLTIHEDARILRIQKHTGCTRAQAQSLIDSGDI